MANHDISSTSLLIEQTNLLVSQSQSEFYPHVFSGHKEEDAENRQPNKLLRKFNTGGIPMGGKPKPRVQSAGYKRKSQFEQGRQSRCSSAGSRRSSCSVGDSVGGSLSRQFQSMAGFKKEARQYPKELAPEMMLVKLLVPRKPVQSQTQLQVNIPDTLVINEQSSQIPNYLLVNLIDDQTARTTLQRRDLPQDNLQMDLSVIKSIFLNNETAVNEIVAVLKTTVPQGSLNCPTKLIRAKEFETVIQELLQRKDQVCLQRFIKPKGAQACKVRTIFQKGDKGNNRFTSFVISNQQAITDSIDQSFIVDLEKEGVSIVKQQRAQEETVIQIKSLMSHLAEQCNLHFESMTVDFIKDEVTEKWYMIGIGSYQFDLQKMSTSGTINLHPFTLLAKDDPRKTDVTLPSLIQSMNTKKSIRPQPPQKVSEKQCGLCQLHFPINKFVKQFEASQIQDAMHSLNHFSNQVTQGQNTQVLVCKDCFLLIRKTHQVNKLTQRLNQILPQNNSMLIDCIMPQGCLTGKVLLYLDYLEYPQTFNSHPKSISYELFGQHQQIQLPTQLIKQDETTLSQNVRSLKIHTFLCQNQDSGKVMLLEALKQLKITLGNQRSKKVLLQAKVEISQSGLYQFEAFLEEMGMRVKGCAALEFADQKNKDQVLLPEALVEYLNQSLKSQANLSTLEYPSVNDSLLMPTRSTTNFNLPSNLASQGVLTSNSGGTRPFFQRNNNNPRPLSGKPTNPPSSQSFKPTNLAVIKTSRYQQANPNRFQYFSGSKQHNSTASNKFPTTDYNCITEQSIQKIIPPNQKQALRRPQSSTTNRGQHKYMKRPEIINDKGIVKTKQTVKKEYKEVDSLLDNILRQKIQQQRKSLSGASENQFRQPVKAGRKVVQLTSKKALEQPQLMQKEQMFQVPYQ